MNTERKRGKKKERLKYFQLAWQIKVRMKLRYPKLKSSQNFPFLLFPVIKRLSQSGKTVYLLRSFSQPQSTKNSHFAYLPAFANEKTSLTEFLPQLFLLFRYHTESSICALKSLQHCKLTNGINVLENFSFLRSIAQMSSNIYV